jgi:hypothetical protein
MLASVALAYGLLGLLAPALAARREDAAASAPVETQSQIESLPKAAVGANAAAPLRRLTLTVEKMDCPPCAARIRGLLKRKPFVRGFFAEEMIHQVTIDYDSGQIDAKKLAALIPARYGVTLIGEEPIP